MGTPFRVGKVSVEPIPDSDVFELLARHSGPRSLWAPNHHGRMSFGCNLPGPFNVTITETGGNATALNAVTVA